MGEIRNLQAVLLGLAALVVAFAGFARRFSVSRRALLQAALAFLRQGQATAEGGMLHVYQDLVEFYQHQLEEVDNTVEAANEQQSAYRLRALRLQQFR